MKARTHLPERYNNSAPLLLPPEATLQNNRSAASTSDLRDRLTRNQPLANGSAPPGRAIFFGGAAGGQGFATG